MLIFVSDNLVQYSNGTDRAGGMSICELNKKTN